MKANELRIGNLIFVDGKETTVKGWMIHLMQIGKNGDKVIEPIQLTEEWLIRFGFENDEDYPEWWTFKSFSMDNTEIGFSYDEDLQVKYVHQLQNLYFALTGEELTLKK